MRRSWMALVGVCFFTAVAAVAEPPSISRVSPFGPGERFQVFGENLQESALLFWTPPASAQEIAAAARHLPAIAELPGTPPEESRTLEPVARYAQVAFVQGWPQNRGMAVVWMKNGDGLSRPWLANRPEVWSQSHWRALPPGTYGVTRTVHVEPNIILKGAGKGATTLTVAYGRRLAPAWPAIQPASRVGGKKGFAVDWEPYLEKRPLTPLVWIETRAGLRDLSLVGGPGVGLLALVATGSGEVAEDVFFNHVNMEYLGRAAVLDSGEYLPQTHGVLVMAFTDGFTMWQCDVEAPGPLDLLPGRHMRPRLIANRFAPRRRNRISCVGASTFYHAMIVDNEFTGRRERRLSTRPARLWSSHPKRFKITRRLCLNRSRVHVSEKIADDGKPGRGDRLLVGFHGFFRLDQISGKKGDEIQKIREDRSAS